MNGARTGDYPYVGKIKSDPHHRSDTETSIPDGLKTNAKGKWGKKKSLEDNIGEYLYVLRVVNNFLKHTHKVQTMSLTTLSSKCPKKSP